ncbi:MAG: dockerin type I domain-containing protein, partial [Phycisphaerales bacterium]
PEPSRHRNTTGRWLFSYGLTSAGVFMLIDITLAALAGLIWSQAPCLTNEEVRQLIIDTADDVHTAGFDNLTGWGRINAGSALAELVGACCPGDANGDGVVNLADLNLVLAHFGEGTQPPIGGQPVIPEAGDLNGDNRVDLADLNIVLAGFGQDCN